MMIRMVIVALALVTVTVPGLRAETADLSALAQALEQDGGGEAPLARDPADPGAAADGVAQGGDALAAEAVPTAQGKPKFPTSAVELRQMARATAAALSKGSASAAQQKDQGRDVCAFLAGLTKGKAAKTALRDCRLKTGR